MGNYALHLLCYQCRGKKTLKCLNNVFQIKYFYTLQL